MKRRLAIIVVVAAVVTIGILAVPRPIPPTEDPALEEEVLIVPRWRPGETRIYELVKSIQKTTQGKSKHQGSSRSRVEISVIEAGENGYLIGWTIQETELDDLKTARDPIVRQITDIMRGWKALIELDAQATATGLRNWRELQSRGKQILELMTGDPKRLGIEPSVINQVRTQVESMFASREQVEELYLRDMGVFFLPLGRSYPRHRTIEYKDELPNPLGGESLPRRGKLKLTSYDEKTGRAAVTWTQTVDSEAAMRIMLDTMRNLGEKVGSPIPDMKNVEAIVKAVERREPVRLPHRRQGRLGRGTEAYADRERRAENVPGGDRHDQARRSYTIALTRCRCRFTFRTTSARWVKKPRWPASSTSSNRALEMASARARCRAAGTTTSRLPAMTIVGTSILQS